MPRRYAVSNVPAYVLIDPNGRILASEYSLEAIESKLKNFADKPSNPPAKAGKPQTSLPPKPTPVAGRGIQAALSRL